MQRTQWILTALLLLLSQLSTAAEKVTVLTSYPQEVVTQFEAAFEKKYPQYHLEIFWRQSHDAMIYLHQQHTALDVYWTPAQRNFAVLAREGAFQKLDINLDGLPKFIGGFQIADQDDYYVASETAGFGIAYHPGELKRLGLKAPNDWGDLAKPGYRGHVVLPIPSQVGYAPMLFDTLLQGYGWEAGWALITQIAANARLANAGATFISDDVGSGLVATGATIDFFAASAIAKGKPLQFAYPEKVGFSPAHVGIFKEAVHLDGAKAFTGFVLSEEGQKLLFHPDIRKLPVRPAVYTSKPDGYFDPFVAAKRATYAYDMNAGIARQELLSALFDAVVTRRHEALKIMWANIYEAEQKHPGHPDVKQARALATWLPVDKWQANDAGLQQIFSQRFKNTELEKSASIIEQKWDMEIASRYAEATRLAQTVLTGNPQK